MTTSLAQQLKKLQVPQTSLLLQDKQRKSLLFDPREAAALDRDTVHAIGLTGLEELEMLDPAFAQFSKTLFAESSKQLERSVCTDEVNQQLNSSISEFLVTLSPYFLLRPAHKAMEWLIYRFHIHLYNVNEVMSCILPFHESRIFVRTLQLFDLSDPASSWHWLMPLQKPGIPLPKSTLITHCYKDLSFMKFICDLVPKYMKVKGKQSVSQSLIGFYVVTILGALENSKNVTEEMMCCLLPYILNGLKSSCLEYCAATYMLISQIATRATLSPSVASDLLEKMGEYVQDDFMQEFTLCMLVIFQHQHLAKIPKKIVSLIKNNTAVQDQLELASGKFQTAALVKLLLVSLIKQYLLRHRRSKNKKMSVLISRVVCNIEIDNKIIKKTVSVLFKLYLKKLKSNKSVKKIQSLEQLRKNCLFVLGLLERKYPEICDRAVESFLNSCKSHQEILLKDLLSTSSQLPEHRLLTGTTTPLFLALNHPSRKRRKAASETLVSLIRSGEIQADSDFARDSVLQRLSDDSPKVVSTILSLNQLLFKVCPKEIQQNLFHMLNKCDFKKWSNVKKKVFSLLCNESDGVIDLDQVTSVVLPFLFPVKSFDYIKNLMSSRLAKTSPVIKHLAIDCIPLNKLGSNKDDFARWTESMLTSLQRASGKLIKLHSLAEQLASVDSNVKSAYIALLLLQQIVHFETDLKVRIQFSYLVLRVIKKSLPVIKTIDDSPALILQALQESHLPDSIVSSSLMALIRSLPQDNIDIQELKMEIFGLLSSEDQPHLADLFSVLLKSFFENQFESVGSALSFLSTFWADHIRGLPENKEFQLAALKKAENILSSAHPSVVETLAQGKSLELLSLFLSLLCPTKEIRSAGVNCLSHITKSQKISEKPVNSLLKQVQDHSEEILCDERQFPQLLFSWLSPSLDPIGHDSKKFSLLKDWLKICSEFQTPDHIQYGTMSALKLCQGQLVLSEVLPVCDTVLNKWEPVGLMESLPYLTLSEVLSKWTPEAAPLLLKTDSQSVVLLKKALSTKLANTERETVQDVALKMISRSFFDAIPSAEVQLEIFDMVLKLYIENRNREKSGLILKTLHRMCGNVHVLVHHLLLPGRTSGDSKKSIKDIRKKRTNTTAQESQVDDESDWKGRTWSKISVVLEVIMSLKEETTSQHALLPSLFEILKVILENLTVESNEETDREYILQLLLSCIHLVISSPSFPSSSSEEMFQVDLVVQCVRLTRNQQTQSQAHMLLNLAGQLFPDRLLHSVMAVFTFMGSSLLRKEDNFSFQVVVQTVDTIVPALLQAKTNSLADGDTEKICAAISRVFVDAAYDIPSQRRLPVFCRLVSAFGAKQNLWLPIVQLVDVSIMKHFPKEEEKFQATGSISPAIQFAISLCAEFPPSVQVKTVLKVIQFLSTLPASKEQWIKGQLKNQEDSTLQDLLDIRSYSEQKLLHFKYTAVTLFCSILSSESFLAKVVDVKPKYITKLEMCYKKLLESLLLYIQNVSAGQNELPLANQKFQKRLLYKLYDLLDKVVSLLPSTQFLHVVESLGNHPWASVRRKALEMLNAKLLNQPKFFSEEDHSLLLAMLKSLMKIAKGRIRTKGCLVNEDKSDENVLNQQTALITILLIAKMLGSTHQSSFTKVLGSLSILLRKKISDVDQHAQLVSNIVLCLAELCSCLRAHSLPHLSSFMPPLLNLLENEEVLFRNHFLLISVITTVQRLVEHLSAFLSSYLPVILMQICCFTSRVQGPMSSVINAQSDENSNKSLTTLQQRLSRICSHISSNIPGRVLLPTVDQCYQNMIQENKHNAIGALMSVLKERISTFEKTDLNAHLQQMKNFFFSALDFRNQQSRNLLSRVNEVEGKILEAMLALVLKLSETSFRPFFYQMYEWAIQEESDVKDRIITFYRLTEIMAERLKSLFVLFANHFIKNASDTLNANNLAKSETLPWGNAKRGQEKSCQLLRHLLSTLHSCFLYDTQHTLVEEECFKSLSQPLVDQLENLLGGEEEYQKRITSQLSPCLAQLAIAAADDSCWKPYQNQILLKTRHTNAKVRFAALKAFEEMVTKLGDDYVTLLPEAIPFLAELLEDENFEVEQQCQEVLSKMEQIVGEPLKKYF